MTDLSEQQIKKDCPHCDSQSFALKHPLEITDNFWVVADVHPLIEGHLLIIPKTHFSCIGEYDQKHFQEFVSLYHQFSQFIKQQYGAISTFEHGKIGQTVFHSHIHLLPFKGKVEEIIPEGKQHLTKLKSLRDLTKIYQQKGKYLFFSIADTNWVVDLSLGQPRFFRDRFAQALGRSKRGNWKQMHDNQEIMRQANKEIKQLEIRWKSYTS